MNACWDILATATAVPEIYC